MKHLVFAAAMALSAPAYAQQEHTRFSEAVETAARDVGKSLRCVVCQNQSIEESGAPLAADMRRMVRERLAAGETADQVVAYMTDRYGNFVRMQPPLQLDTLLLWFGPLLLLAGGACGWLVYLRPSARAPVTPAPLTESEERELAQRLQQGTEA